MLEKDEEKGGRRITQSGQRDLDREFLGFSFSFFVGGGGGLGVRGLRGLGEGLRVGRGYDVKGQGQGGGDIKELLYKRLFVRIANRVSSTTGIAQTTLEESDEEDDE